MNDNQVKRIKTISEYHRSRGLSPPLHPLISLIDYRSIKHSTDTNKVSWVNDFFLIALKKNIDGNTQQHIHEKLIDKVKENLSTTNLSITEIAYTLGFEYPQSFSKLFKSKTRQSPSEFRASFK